MPTSPTLSLAHPLRGLGATGILFGLRTTAATLVALWLAMGLQLDTPRWAAWTVMSLALPTRGAVAAKGLWRAGGTLLGLAGGLIAVAIFAQSAIAMGLFLATWFALNAYVGGSLPGLAAYGAALSGTHDGTRGDPERLRPAFDLQHRAGARRRYLSRPGMRLCREHDRGIHARSSASDRA